MRLPAAAHFWEEQRRFDLRFCCEDCVHFDPSGERCVHGWPAEDHRRGRYLAEDVEQIVFCKEFELL